MGFTGKRTDRIRMPRQIGLDPEMGLIIRSRATRRGRSIEMQLVHLIGEGIRYDSETRINVDDCDVLHTTARSRTPEQGELHMGAQPRSAKQTQARRAEKMA